MKLEASESSEYKRKWKVIRTDSYNEVSGEIISADEDTGECSVKVNGETKTISLGNNGLRIIAKR